MYRIYKRSNKGTYRLSSKKQFPSYEAARKTAVRLVRKRRNKTLEKASDRLDGYPTLSHWGYKIRKVA